LLLENKNHRSSRKIRNKIFLDRKVSQRNTQTRIMQFLRRKPASLLALLYGMALIFVATTTTEGSVASEEQPELDVDVDIDIDAEAERKIEYERIYDPHIAVLMWLNNRANYAEDNHFVEPWKDYIDDGHDDYHYQNGFYFAKQHIRVLSGYNNNVKIDGGGDSDDNTGDSSAQQQQQLPRIVATTDISKGELLVGVPSNSFVYKRTNPTYKILHPCDVASKMLNARTYRFPEDGEEDIRGLPALDEFVRPFLDSLLSYHQDAESIVGAENRQLWSVEQLESLKKILGNELDPKANTLGLWGEDENMTTTTFNRFPVLCRHPNPKDRESNRIIDHFYNNSNPLDNEFQSLFRVTVATVVTRSWNHRLVPIYHWIPRSDDFNVFHSETNIDENKVMEKYWQWESEESGDAPSIYQLHASKDIKKGEILVLPYHSVAQKFAIEGKIGRDKAKEEKEDTSYRFWTQTLHDQWGTDLMFGDRTADPYSDYLSWDYYPKNKTIEWVHKSTDTSNIQPKQTLRNTQRNVLHAQYLRLRAMEEEVKGLLVPDPSNVGNLAIVEYYELWVESLGLLLANARPNRSISTDSSEECPPGADGDDEDEESCASVADPTPAPAFDDLRERFNGDPLDYNRFVASHDCTNLFTQTTYEETRTPYAFLEWTRSYIGGGDIGDHMQDPTKEAVDEREQDTCLHLENVLHSCLAFRPHVHETLIHYPASFLPKNGMKRVLYVGGGDLVLLHELLRYKSVELVIGMEIDQTVLRHSFRHYGIQPKFEDERVHWWFGDAAKSLTLLPPEEYFGTFDMVLIDLVVEIFDGLRVGDHNERLVDYMAKLLKPEGILVRQEDWPLHNTIDFAKYTVDLNLFGMPHTCSQYFTMASNTVDFSNHERVDHELEDLVWYEPKIESHDHTAMWGDYRNNLDPPERICKETKQESTHVLPSKGLFVAIEAENVSMDLGELPLLQKAVSKGLDELGFSKITRLDISFGEPSTFSSMLFVFEEGYLAIRSFPEQKYSSMDLQLWNDIPKQEIVVSTLVGAIGGNTIKDSTSTFLITTGGMFGTSNIDDHSTPMVPSAWCKGYYAAEGGQTSTGVETLSGLEIVVEEMLTNFVGKGDYIVMVLCPSESSRCRVPEDTNFGPEAQVFAFHACPEIANGDESTLERCQQQMRQTITNALSQTNDTTKKIRAIVIDPEAPRELGQIATKLFVNDPSSYQWLSHDYIVLAPSESDAATASSGYPLSWRYQLLERFRTDMVEFQPVYHATVSFRDVPSSSSEWAIGVLSAGNPRFYGHLVDFLDAIRGNTETKFQEVILVETNTGAISHIPDYQPSKWATPSDYDIKPAEQQYSEQQPVGVQILVQYEKIADIPHDIEIGATILFFQEKHDYWTGVSTFVTRLISKDALHCGVDIASAFTHKLTCRSSFYRAILST
jgi:spermidine synthase